MRDLQQRWMKIGDGKIEGILCRINPELTDEQLEELMVQFRQRSGFTDHKAHFGVVQQPATVRSGGVPGWPGCSA